MKEPIEDVPDVSLGLIFFTFLFPCLLAEVAKTLSKYQIISRDFVIVTSLLSLLFVVLAIVLLIAFLHRSPHKRKVLLATIVCLTLATAFQVNFLYKVWMLMG
jgi:hypothetical protein